MKNSKLRRILLTLACAVLLVSLSVGATLAYLTSTTDVVQNTFTVGSVAIKLTEGKVTGDGTTQEHDTRVLANEYHLQPGLTYPKDPTVTVAGTSEDCYVRMIVTVTDYNQLKFAFPAEKYPELWNGDMFLLQNIVVGWDEAKWPCYSAANGVYEFRYYKIVESTVGTDANLEDLFTAIQIPGQMTNAELDNLSGIKINVVAHAIQADGFNGEAAAAWNAFDAQ